MSAPAVPSSRETARDPIARDLALTDRRPQTTSRARTVWGVEELVRPLALSETERRFRFRGVPQAVGAARRVLREWEGHFDPILFYDLSLCVSELVTNRVQQRDAAASEIELAVRRGDRMVRAEISDQRPGSPIATPAAMTTRDWGMFIVDRVADRWGVEHRDGMRMWCEIDLSRDGRSRNTPEPQPA